MWPTAVAIVVLIPLVARAGTDPSGTYRIGSLTFYLNAYGPFVLLAAMTFAGLRWCWLGHLRPRKGRRCACCGYPSPETAIPAPDARCSECGADAIAQRTHTLVSLVRECFRGVTLGRLAIDLPGILILAYGAFVVMLITLVLFGLISID
jgi:hypothetical protein